MTKAAGETVVAVAMFAAIAVSAAVSFVMFVNQVITPFAQVSVSAGWRGL